MKKDVKYKVTSSEGVTIGYFLNGLFSYATTPNDVEGEIKDETDFISYLNNPGREVTGHIEDGQLVRLADKEKFDLKEMA